MVVARAPCRASPVGTGARRTFEARSPRSPRARRCTRDRHSPPAVAPCRADAMDAKIADLKDRANKELMVEKRYAAAEALYTEALALNPSNVLLHSNRSLARYLQSNYSGALADAEQAVQLDPSWLKGHFHRVRALQALGGKQREARVAYSVGLDVAGGRDNASYLSLQEQVERDYIATHYAALTADLPVEVRWIDADKGKGLFSKRAVRMFQPIFSEAPLVSHRKLTCARDSAATPATHPSCAHCLRSFVSEHAVRGTRFASVWDRIYGGASPDSMACEWKWCDACATRAGEVVADLAKQKRISSPDEVPRDPYVTGNPFYLERYCGEACRARAYAQWHRCLCGAKFVSDAQRVHPLHHLYNLCVTTGRTNPLMIARVYGIVFQRVMEHGVSADEAFQDFRNFASAPEPTAIDDMAVFLLKNMFVGLPEMDRLITVDNYQRLNGAIMRNAQTITPVSDLHMWFERALGRQGASGGDLMAELGFTPDSLKDYMASDAMLGLCKVEGTGLYAVANCMNHSCDPNVISSSSSNDHTMTFVALRPIEEGEELCISYVDDNQDWQERNAQLEKFYGFQCKCMRCYVGRNDIKIIQ